MLQIPLDPRTTPAMVNEILHSLPPMSSVMLPGMNPMYYPFTSPAPMPGHVLSGPSARDRALVQITHVGKKEKRHRARSSSSSSSSSNRSSSNSPEPSPASTVTPIGSVVADNGPRDATNEPAPVEILPAPRGARGEKAGEDEEDLQEEEEEEEGDEGEGEERPKKKKKITGAQFHRCTFCGVTFSRKASLLDHVASKHDKIRVQCPWAGCMETYSRYKSLVRHMANVHDFTATTPVESLPSCMKCKKPYSPFLKQDGICNNPHAIKVIAEDVKL